eukprot:1333891-Amorphochlora_amoeboformis.AAC.1
MLAPRRQGSSYNSFRDPEEPQHPPTLARIMSNPERQPSGLTEAGNARCFYHDESSDRADREYGGNILLLHLSVESPNEQRLHSKNSPDDAKYSGRLNSIPSASELRPQFLQALPAGLFREPVQVTSGALTTHPRCFYTDEKQSVCNVEISVADIKAVATEEALKKYTYFMNKTVPSAKPNSSETPGTHGLSAQMPTHPKEKACAEFEAEQRREERKNRSWRSAHTRPCPKCGVATEKNEGCNHMTCFVCKTGWCWLCGEIIGNQVLPDHYKSGECKGKQFTSESVPYMAPWEAIVCIMVPAFFFLLFSPIAFVMAIVVCILYPCLSALCCCSEDQNNQQGWNRCMG